MCNFISAKRQVPLPYEAGSKLVADRFKAKFHYASWFEAGSKLVADRIEAGRRPASNQIA